MPMTPRLLFPLLTLLVLLSACEKTEPYEGGVIPDASLAQDSRIVGLLKSAAVGDIPSAVEGESNTPAGAGNQVPANLNCEGIVYPQTLAVRNPTTGVTEEVVIESNEAFYAFLENLNVEDLVGVSFPFEVGLSDGEVYAATNYQELEEVLSYFKETCLNGGVPSGEDDAGEDDDAGGDEEDEGDGENEGDGEDEEEDHDDDRDDDDDDDDEDDDQDEEDNDDEDGDEEEDDRDDDDEDEGDGEDEEEEHDDDDDRDEDDDDDDDEDDDDDDDDDDEDDDDEDDDD